MRTCCVLAVALALASCKKDEADAAKQAPAVQAPPARLMAVEIFIDDQSVAKIALPQLGQWPRLDTLVPTAARRLGTWQDVTVKNKDKPLEIHKPSDTYRDLVPALYLTADNTPAFGMFDPVELAKHGNAAVHAEGVSELRIKLAQNSGRGEHESGDGGGSDPSLLKIKIKTASGESVLEGSKLLAIPRQPMPGDASNEPKGWPLATVLDAGGIKKFERVLLSEAGGSNLTLDKADFDPKTSVPYVKLNRQGALRVTVFKKQGEGWQKGGDLRGLASIEVVK
jgi:hypothetical protein